MQTELRGKIGNPLLGQIGKFTHEPFLTPSFPPIQVLHRDLVFTQEVRIARRSQKPLRIDLMEKLYRIMLGVFPKLRVQAFKQ